MITAFVIVEVLVLVLALTSIGRYTAFMVGSSLYDIQKHLRERKITLLKMPTITVVIPAYNEENTIGRSVSSVIDAVYDREKLQIIVIDDGSRDQTSAIVEKRIKSGEWKDVQLITQPNAGKAHALNNAIKNYAHGELVMCLDADSTLKRDALMKAAAYFRVPQTVALLANVRIRRDGTLINLVQYYEYIIGWQMKRASSFFNIEYIIGGIGSVFRRSALEAVNYYDTNSVVEDMDLTFKLLRLGNKEHRIVYGSDVICYTEGVLSVAGLLKQRYRWKYGHFQTLLKYSDMFFSREEKYAKQFTWFYLPFVFYSEFALLVEPIMPLFILFLFYWFGDFVSLCSGLAVVSIATTLHIFAEETLTLREKAHMAVSAPIVYFANFFYLFIWYISVLRTFANIRNILSDTNSKWEPVKRSQIA
jgi:biofilm PGA synthesis N-glycosyltransferase PgaC